MAQMQIRGNTQIMAGTITDAQISATAAIASSKLADGANWIKKDGTVAFTAAQSMGGFKLTNVLDPTTAQDAATKNYVDNMAGSGLSVKPAVLYTTTAAITLTGLSTQAGGDWASTLTAADRILVKNQADPTTNGIYAASATAWTRTTDFNSNANILPNSFVFAEKGTALADTGWVLTTDPPVSLGTSNLTFVQFSSAGSYVGGNGITITGNSIAVTAGNGISVSSGVAIALADSTLSVGGPGLKLAPLTSANILVGNGSNVATGVAMSGDVTITNTGATTVSASFQKTAGFVDEEVPSGAINGSNTAFTLSFAPVASTAVKAYLNGLRLKYGAGADFTVSGTALTMVTVPSTGDTLVVEYRK